MLDAVNIISSPIVWVVGLGLVVLAAANKQGKHDKKGGGMRQAIAGALGAVAQTWASVLFGLPVVSSIARGFVNRHDGAWIQRWMDKRFSESNDPMLRGGDKDRFDYAQAAYPPKKFPSLWMSAPKDLQRSLVSDGALITGDPMSTLAECSVTQKHQDYAAKAGASAFAVWFSLLILAWHPGIILGSFGSASLASASADVARVSSDPALISRTLDRDYWDQASYAKAIESRKSELEAPRSAGLSLAAIAIDLAMSLAVALSVALLMAHATFRATFRSVLAVIGKEIHDGTKEQVIRGKGRLDQRMLDYASWVEQVDFATKLDKTPTIGLGTATGIYRFRGRMDAPYQGQQMRISTMDLRQHMLIFGGTGQGKTFSFIKPVLKQLLEIRRVQRDRAIEMRSNHLALPWERASILPKSQSIATRAAGEFVWPWGIKPSFDHYEEVNYPSDVSVLLTDGKAVFYHDVKQIIAERGLHKDFMVIGVDEAAGEVSVDLLDRIEPQTVADYLKSIASQAGGGNDNDIWPNMAAELIRCCAVVARVFDRTDEGIAWIDAHKGERPYSLVFIYDLCVDRGPLLSTVLNAIGRAEDDPNLFPQIKDLYTVELFDAVKYLQEEWLTLVQETKQGIMINIKDLLGGFSSNPKLRGSFAGASGKNQVSADEFWGKISVTNLSTGDFGISGRIINVFIKILFMAEAQRRERETKAERSSLQDKFFRMFPSLSVVDATIEELSTLLAGASENLYTPTQHADFNAYAAAAQVADDQLAEALMAAGVELPMPTGSIKGDIAAKRALFAALDAKGLGEAGQAAKKSAERALAALASASINFKEAHYDLAVRRVFLGDNRALDPRLFEKRIIEGDTDGIVEDARKVDPSADHSNIVQKAHEIYHMWRVVHTRLDGLGEGAIREQMFFFGDEYQTLITIDPKDGAPSDSSFPNVARSTGVGLIIATQTYATLKLAVGEDACKNFCGQFRTKIFLQVEEATTTEVLKDLAGKTLRSQVFDANGYESYDAMRMETGAKDVVLDGITEIAINGADPTSPMGLLAGAQMALTPSALVSANDAVTIQNRSQKLDHRFVMAERRIRTNGGGVDSNADQIVSAKQQAAWRAEDLHHKDMSEGNQEMDCFRAEDITLFGRNHACMFVMRAGKSRMDYVKLSQDSSITI